MLKIIISLVCVIGLGINVGFAKDMEFKSSGFSVKIRKNGMLKDLKVGKTNLIRLMMLHGNYKPAPGVEKHDKRFFQSQNWTPAKMTRPDAKSMIIEQKNVVIGNKKYPKGLVYSEKLTLSPNKISVEYDVEIKEKMGGNAAFLMTLSELPLSLVGRGFKFKDFLGKETMGIIPPKYSPKNRINYFGKELAFSLPEGLVTIMAGENTKIYFTDSRSWKGDHLRLDIAQNIPWKSKITYYKAGTKFKWSFTIIFKKN